MSSKLDQSLDDILSTRRKTTSRRGRGRGRPAGTRATAAPAGGVQKVTKPGKAAAKAAIPTGPTAITGDSSKIIVSNLVSESHCTFTINTNASSPPM